MCIYKGKAPSVSWPQITFRDSIDLFIEALTPDNVIVYDSGAFGGVCRASGGA